MKHSKDSILRFRDDLIREIHRAFQDVSRRGGVSWSMAKVIDMYGSSEERFQAGERDRDTHWSQLIDDPAWDPECGTGGFVFLDAIGFRYYLPAAMVRAIRSGEDLGLLSHLRQKLGQRGGVQWTPSSWLSTPMLRCVARFALYMTKAVPRLQIARAEEEAATRGVELERHFRRPPSLSRREARQSYLKFWAQYL